MQPPARRKRGWPGPPGGGRAGRGRGARQEFEQDEQVGDFATGQEDLEEFPEDARLGSFAKGQEAQQNVQEGTFGKVQAPAEE